MEKTRISIGIDLGEGIHKLDEIIWAVEEDFSELKAYGPVYLTKTKAVDIEAMCGLSTRSKILLSAVAGAAWQHIFDVTDFNRSWYTGLVIYVEEECV